VKKLVHVSRLVVSGFLLGAWLPFSHALAASSQDATITVTPAALVSLDLPTTTYAFGVIPVNTSTNSATSLTLTNSGEVSVAVSKQITVESNPAGWTANTSVGLDNYVLYCATSTTRLNVGSFGAATMFGAVSNSTPLTGPTGSAPTLPPVGAGQSVDLWFRLDMPNKVTSLTGRTITVRFTATSL